MNTKRRRRGFDDKDMWNLDITIAKFVLPRLMAFKNYSHGCPGELNEKQWADILDKIIFAFDFVIKVNDTVLGPKQWNKEYKKYQVGIKLFAKYFRSLWY